MPDGALLAVDNSFATPILQQPAKLGADIVVHAGTKFLDGQGRVMVGAVCGSIALVDKVMGTFLRSGGSECRALQRLDGDEGAGNPVLCASRRKAPPRWSWRSWLEAHPQVARVYYPGLQQPSAARAGHAPAKWSGRRRAVVRCARARAPRQLRTSAFHVIDHTQVCSITANLGDVKTTITHPASTSHGRLTEAQRQAAGIGQGLIRMSVGLEHLDDLKADLVPRTGYPDQ